LNEALSELGEVSADEEVGERLSDDVLSETATDKGYHSNRTMKKQRALGIRTYCSEPDRGRRNWQGKSAERDAVYANRRRVVGERGKRPLRKRDELLERPFAHCYDAGGMRRTHLRGHPNILKRLLIHVAGFNLGLVMRKVLGVGLPPRGKPPAGRILASIIGLMQGFRSRMLAPASRWRPASPTAAFLRPCPAQPEAH